MENKRLRPHMVDLLNLFLEEIGTVLRYQKDSTKGNRVYYDLVTVDDYIDNRGVSPIPHSRKFERLVTKFFRNVFGINIFLNDIQNTVDYLIAYENDDDIIGIARADGTVEYKVINNKRKSPFPVRKHEFDEIEKMLDTWTNVEPLKDDGEIIEEKIFHTTSKEKSVNNSEEKVL